MGAAVVFWPDVAGDVPQEGSLKTIENLTLEIDAVWLQTL
jgi:hypothetical protein